MVAIACLVGLVGTGFMFLFGMAIGQQFGEGIMKEEAVRLHAAHYIVNPRTGKAIFVWGPGPPP